MDGCWFVLICVYLCSLSGRGAEPRSIKGRATKLVDRQHTQSRSLADPRQKPSRRADASRRPGRAHRGRTEGKRTRHLCVCRRRDRAKCAARPAHDHGRIRARFIRGPSTTESPGPLPGFLAARRALPDHDRSFQRRRSVKQRTARNHAASTIRKTSSTTTAAIFRASSIACRT